jgi:hypothetical protein
MKSAKALDDVRAIIKGDMSTHRSFETVLNSEAFSGLVCILKLAVRTNCPTVALKPARKALNGYTTVSI